MYRVHPNGRENGPLSFGHNGAVSFPMGERRGYSIWSASRNNNSCNSRRNPTSSRPRLLNKYNTRVIWLLGERLTGAVDPVCTPSIARGCLSSPPSFMLSPQYKPLSARGSISLPFSSIYIYIYIFIGMDGHLTNVSFNVEMICSKWIFNYVLEKMKMLARIILFCKESVGDFQMYW